jgi:hypothetical protein
MRETKQLKLAIDAAVIAARAELVGSTDVADMVIESNRDLIRSISDELSRRFVRRMVQDSMKKSSEEEGDMWQSSMFPDLHGLPQALSLLVDGNVKYIGRKYAKCLHWKGHIEYLAKLISDDSARLAVIKAADRRLDVLRGQYGDLSEVEFVEMTKGAVA